MAWCGWACSLAPWTDWIGRRAQIIHYLPARGRREYARCRNQRQQHLQRSFGLPLGRRRWQRSGPVRRAHWTLQALPARPRRDPRSLVSNNVYTIYGDRSGQMWLGLEGGISRFDPATDGFVNYPVPDNPASLASTVWVIHQDRSGALWAGTWGGVLIRFDEKAKAFVSYAPDSRDPRKLNGGGINTILEDRTGTLWVGTFDGLYRHDRRSGAFARYTESAGPAQQQHSMHSGRSTSAGSGSARRRAYPGSILGSGTFRNYDVSDGLQSDEFSTGCFQAAGWGDLLRRQQWVQRIRPRERSGRRLRAAGRDHELHHFQPAGAHRG